MLCSKSSMNYIYAPSRYRSANLACFLRHSVDFVLFLYLSFSMSTRFIDDNDDDDDEQMKSP